MAPLTLDAENFRLLAEALAIGFLVGVERYKARDPGEKRFAGVRTFAAFSLLGGICGLLDSTNLTLGAFVALTALVAIGYYREAEEHIGLTTEVAALLVFWLGYLVHSHEALAISVAIILTIMLASKGVLHTFIRETLTETELFDTLKFLAVVLVVYPLLPDRDLGPFEFFNPARIWLLVVLVSTISYVGYILMRTLGRHRGLALSSILGGIVSTTAVTMSLAGRARESPESSRLLGVLAVMANAMQFPRLLILLWVIEPNLARFFVVPLLGMTTAGLVGAGILAYWRRSGIEPEVELPLRNPYSLRLALRFGLFFVGILFLVRALEAWLGESGIQLASVLGGAASASAVTLSVADLVGKDSLSITAGAMAILLGIFANALTKGVMTLAQGTRQLAFWLGGGLLTMLATGFLLLYLSRGSLSL
jgi:uncharacterized membrane protein (DUF4010 family)